MATLLNSTLRLSRDLILRFSRGFIKSIKCVDDKLFVNDIEISNISDVIYETEI